MAAVKVTLMFVFSCVCFVLCDRIKDKIYINIAGSYACFRRLNGTHQIGCASERLGNVGVVHVVEDKDDLAWLINEGPHAPYMAILYPQMFIKDKLLQLKQSGKVNGIVLLSGSNTTKPQQFSHEQQCPNRDSGLYNRSLNHEEKLYNYPWNPEGSGMMYIDWGIPIFLVNDDTSIQQIRSECYLKFNKPSDGIPREWPLCAMELKSTMLAAVNSPTCIRRSRMGNTLNPVKVCDALKGRNIWGTLLPRNKSADTDADTNRSVVVVAARLDTFSMFDQLERGADTPITGLVTLLAAANLLATYRSEVANISNGKNVIFIIFNGESFDYIGSSRMVYDMEQGVFPIQLDENIVSQPPLLNLSGISHFLELGQVSMLDPEMKLYIHTDPLSQEHVLVHTKTEEVIEKMKNESGQVNLLLESVVHGDPLPPASLHSFLRQDLQIPGVVITDYNRKFVNRYYHNFYDNAENIGYAFNSSDLPAENTLQQHLAKLTSVVARTVYYLLTGQHKEMTANETLINEMMHCYLDTTNCSLFRASTSGIHLKDQPVTMYVGVSSGTTKITKLTKYLMAYLTGEKVDKKKADCHNDLEQQVYQYMWMRGDRTQENATDDEQGICIQATVGYSLAASPAFDIEGYDWSSGEYPTWTESVWQEFTVRVFLKPSKQWETVTFCIGALVLLLSLVVVYFINSRANTLFGSRFGVGV